MLGRRLASIPRTAARPPLIRVRRGRRPNDGIIGTFHRSKRMCAGSPRVRSGLDRSPSAALRKRRTRRRSRAASMPPVRRRQRRHRHHPTASRVADTGARYERLFGDLGAGRRRRRSTSTAGATAPSRAGFERLQRRDRRLLHWRQPAAPVHGDRRHADREAAIRTMNAAGVHVGGTRRARPSSSEHMTLSAPRAESPVAAQ